MNDRERVLINIAVDTSGSVHDTVERLPSGWSLRFHYDRPAPQFIPEEMAKAIGMPMVPGDIVRCKTNPNHEWGIAELVEKLGYAECLLKLIGGDKTLRMGNESFDVLRFMWSERLYTGAKFRVYTWVRSKAFSERYNPDGDYFKRCGGVSFDGDQLTIWSRPHIWCMEKKDADGNATYAHPKKFVMPWSNRTKLRDIIAAMKEQGFAEDFEYTPEKPTEGQAGYASFTRESLLKFVQDFNSPLTPA